MANETAADRLGESATDEHNVLYVSMVTGGDEHLRAVCVFARTFRALQHNPLLKNTFKERVDADPV